MNQAENNRLFFVVVVLDGLWTAFLLMVEDCEDQYISQVAALDSACHLWSIW